MVYVVKADIARKELQQPRQLQVRAALERGAVVSPVAVVPPVRVLELVLYVKQPDRGSARDDEYWPLHQEILAPNGREARRVDRDRERGVGAEHAPADARTRATRDEARLEHEHEQPAEPEH